MAKFFVDESAISGGYIYIEDGDFKHLTKVLRHRIGDVIEVSDSQVWEYKGEIAEISSDYAKLKILDKQKFATEPKVKVTLYQGIPKASKMELIIQKSVEIGAVRVVPVFMDRTIVVEKGNFHKKVDRWQKISDEAAKQCKRGILPKIENSCTLKEILPELKKDYDLVLCPYENEEDKTIKDCLKEFKEEVKADSFTLEELRVAVIIGPEGGFDEKEIDFLVEAGARLATLGKTTLRTETAGMVAISMVMYEMEL